MDWGQCAARLVHDSYRIKSVAINLFLLRFLEAFFGEKTLASQPCLQ
jgi:hypothetical protein